MDSMVNAAGRALAGGDALGALRRVALRDDPPALAVRGIALAQLGELTEARVLLRRAARGFGAHEAVARARCQVAEAEVALALRDLGTVARPLASAAAVLAAHGDRANATHARLILARQHVLLGRLDAAAATLGALDGAGAAVGGAGLRPTHAAIAALLAAELALRALDVPRATAALAEAADAAGRAGVPALRAEVTEAAAALRQPAARAEGRDLRLDEAAALLASGTLVLDACRHGVRAGAWRLSLARRPILFALARVLAERWPGEADRATLIAAAFRQREPDDTHRARLRVELGRLRRLLHPVLSIEATERGFRAVVPEGQRLVVLAPPIEGEQAALRALLADGAAWSTSALALALDASQRTVQRALADLEAAGEVRSIGQARARRWLAPPIAGWSTALLLPGVA